MACSKRVQALQDAGSFIGMTESGAFTFEIVNEFFYDDHIELFARVWKDGAQLGFGADGSVDIERFHITNPPIYVIDPEGDVALSTVTRPDGSEVTTMARLAPKDAVIDALVRSAEVGGRTGTEIIAGKVGRTTYTIYPTTSFWVDSSGSSLSSALNGNNLSGVQANGNLQLVNINAGDFEESQSFLRFNTSSVSGTISSVQLTATVMSDQSSVSKNDTINARLVGSLNTTTLENNWKAPAAAAAQTLLATQAISHGVADDTTYNFTSDGNFVSNIQSGNTDIGLYLATFEASTNPGSPGQGYGINLYDETASGTSQDPVLVIVAGSGITGQMFAGCEV